MAPPKMIVTDLDGTLLSSDGRVSERTAATLGRARAAGVPVVIATGRPPWWLEPLRQIGFDGFAACMNGSVLIDLGRWQVLRSTPMPVSTLTAVVAAMSVAAPGCHFALERTGMSADDAYAEPGFSHEWDGDFQRVSRDELLATPAIKLFVRWGQDSEELAQRLVRCDIPGAAATYSTNDGLIEVGNAEVNKAIAVAELARWWGIDATEVICFGDMPNDVPMVAWAGRGIAMGNAHQQVRAVADEVAPANDEEGVAAVLERWF